MPLTFPCSRPEDVLHEYYRLFPASRNKNEDEKKRKNPRLGVIGARERWSLRSLTLPMRVACEDSLSKLNFGSGRASGLWIRCLRHSRRVLRAYLHLSNGYNGQLGIPPSEFKAVISARRSWGSVSTSIRVAWVPLHQPGVYGLDLDTCVGVK